MTVDRRVSAILDRLAGAGSGGEAVAAFAALQRLLPRNVEMADVLTVGLHHLRQDISDPSLIAELRRLTAATQQAERRVAHLEGRARTLEHALRAALADLEDMRQQLPDAQPADGAEHPQDRSSG